VAAAVTGAWAARTLVPNPPPYQAPIDPEHLTPTDNPEYVHEAPMWQATAQMPALPEDLLANPGAHLATGIGPVNMTPEDHEYGVGVGSGLTTLESQDRMAAWHNDDQGAVAAHRWVHPTDRDGTYHAEMYTDVPGDGDSPATVALERTGVGAPSDEGRSRLGRWQKRWWNRQIDMHRYAVEYGPVRPQYARPNPARGDVSPGNQLTPPYGNSIAYDGSKPQDRFVTQVVRAQPDDWAADQATDGAANNLLGYQQQYGLTVWGL